MRYFRHIDHSLGAQNKQSFESPNSLHRLYTNICKTGVAWLLNIIRIVMKIKYFISDKLSSRSLFAAVFVALVTVGGPQALHAEALQCQQVFLVAGSSAKAQLPTMNREALEGNYSKRNEILVKRYPQLEFVFRDPEGFVKTMQSRFEAQKKITPEDPRMFNFPEAKVTMQEIRVDLEKFRQELTVELQTQKETFRNRLSHLVLHRRATKVETLTKTLKYINKLQTDIDRMVTADHFPYRDTVYTLYFYSRVRGLFQFKELGTYYQVAKYIDMWMHGFRRLNVDQEIRLYEAKNNPLLQVRSGKIAQEFRTAELPFKDAFERVDKLEYVIIPSVYALGSSAFMHVLPHKIHFIGATNTPIHADGFSRPGGLFWMHDVRHEADRYMKVNAYRKAQNLTARQEETLSLYTHQWHADFLNMKNAVSNADVKAALDHYHFYTHHDVGVPLIPSMFLNHHRDGLSVYYAFLFHKKAAGQTPNFNKWLASTQQAQKLLEQFWTERLAQEKSLLQRDPVKIKEWSEWFPKSHKPSTQVSLLNKAIESTDVVRLKTEDAGIEGVLNKAVYGESGNVIFVQFSGRTQLVNKANQVLPGQGPTVHGEGYSTPLGLIKSVLVNGQESSFAGLKAHEVVELRYESGIVVKGELQSWTKNESGQVSILTFKTAEVTVSNKVLYKPEWGSFDLLLGKEIKSLEFL